MANLLDMIFGQKPKVAKFKPLNLGAEQKSAISGDIGAFPAISQLGDMYQSYLTDQLNQQLPGFSDLMKQGVVSAEDLMQSAIPLEQGTLPKNVIDSLRRQSAQDAVSGGYAGSQMGENDWLRNLGIGELQGMQMGANLAG